MKKPSLKCPGCGVRIYVETTKPKLAFPCKKCGHNITVDVPLIHRSTFRVPNDPVLTYETSKKPVPTPAPAPAPKPSAPKPNPAPQPKSKLQHHSGNAYIKISPAADAEMRRYLQINYPELLVDCPSLEDAVDYVLKKVFPHNIMANYVVTNNSYYTSENNIVENISIRSVVSGFLQSRLYDHDRQLRISGMISSFGILYVNRLDIVRNAPLMFNEQEMKCRIIHGSAAAQDSCLHEAAIRIPTYSKEMQDELSLWGQYLDWKQKLAELKIRSVKYIGVRVEEDDLGPIGISFLAVAPERASYEKFVKTLKREGDNIAIVANNNSKHRWVFSYCGINVKADREILLPFDGVSNNPAPDYLWEETTSYLHKGHSLSISEARAAIAEHRDLYPDPVYFEVSFGFPSEDLAIFDRDEMSGADIRNYLNRNLLARIYQDGFIATSLLGDFLLNARLKRAVSDLSMGHATSGNLGNWIFDITKARVATSQYRDLQWSPWVKEHLNESQKEVVREMLAAPDVYLCQGPPGTGKTTVISEIVYQLAIRNKRVLIASQTNLAVNNALSRLVDYPGIRAIRLGAEQKLDETVDAISDQNILRTFFSRIKDGVERRYIAPWDDQDARAARLRQDLVVAGRLATEYATADKQLRQIQAEITAIDQSIAGALARSEENYELIERQKNQAMRLGLYADALEQHQKPKEPPFLDAQQADQLYEWLRDTITAFAEKGYVLLPEYTDIQNGFKPLSRKETNYAVHDLVQFFLFAHICRTSLATGATNGGASQMLRDLQIELRELEEKEDISFEEFQKLQGIKKSIKKLQEGGYEEIFPVALLRFLPEPMRSTLKNGTFTTELKNDFVTDTSRLAEKGIDALIGYCRKYVEMTEAVAGQEDEELNRLRQQKKALGIKLEEAHSSRENILTQQSAMASAYSCQAQHLVDTIQLAQRHLEGEQIQDSVSRADFEPFLREFVSHIDALGDDYSMENSEYLKDFINACNVVGISCTESSNTLTRAGFNTFDVAIIDEVSKATPPELLIPLLLAEKAILVGDHRQLPPLFGEHAVTYYDYIQDIADDDQETKDLLSLANYDRFEELVTNSLFKRHYEQADPANKGPLLKQYRMHREIMDVVNMFYDSKLEAGIPVDTEVHSKAHHAIIRSYQGGVSLVSPDHHAYWIDSSSLHGTPAYETQARGSSKFNRLEAVLIAKMVQQIDDSYRAAGCTDKVEVGIISFYAAQVREIRQEISKKCKLTCVSCDVNTVDRFQGKEKPIVIVSLVRNVKAGKKYDATYVKAYQRINVAVSRAQNLLLLVGAKDMYIDQEIPMEDMETGKPSEPQYVYRNMIEKLNMRGCFITADDILSHDAGAEVFES